MSQHKPSNFNGSSALRHDIRQTVSEPFSFPRERYNSGTAKTPDVDVADAFVALCTAILRTENGCRTILAPNPTCHERLVKEWEGAIREPAITTSAMSDEQ